MAKRRKKTTPKNADRQQRLMRLHIEALDLTVGSYPDWCWKNGFHDALDKSDADRASELAFHQQVLERNAAIDKVLHDPKKLISYACANKMQPDELSRIKWSSFCLSVQYSTQETDQRRSLEKLLLVVNERADFLFEQLEIDGQTVHYVDALIALNGHRRQWVRPLEDWRPGKHNRKHQFGSLLRHLWAQYRVPAFMDSVWLLNQEGAPKYRDWFIHIGSGQNIRGAKKLPLPLTKRMAHQFLDTPDDYNVLQALRWAQIHGLDGDARLTQALLATEIGEDFAHHKFWQTVFVFFINNPLLDRRHVGPIIDYLQFQKFTIQEVMAAPQIIQRIPPPQPNLTMQGRTPAALLRQVDDWHTELSRSSNVHGLTFKPSGIKGFEKKQAGDQWSIRELRTGTQLIKEGNELHHCVSTYADSCMQGHCSIWTMERVRNDKTHKHLTIEVQRQGMIVQVRGKHNRLCTRPELDLIRQWTNEAELSIDTYVEVND